jgi:hypothetical protein
VTNQTSKTRKHIVIKKIALSETASEDPRFTNHHWLSLVQLPTTESNWYKYRLILNEEICGVSAGQRIVRIDGSGPDEIASWMDLIESRVAPSVLQEHFKMLLDLETEKGPEYGIDSKLFDMLSSEIEKAG